MWARRGPGHGSAAAGERRGIWTLFGDEPRRERPERRRGGRGRERRESEGRRRRATRERQGLVDRPASLRREREPHRRGGGVGGGGGRRGRERDGGDPLRRLQRQGRRRHRRSSSRCFFFSSPLRKGADAPPRPPSRAVVRGLLQPQGVQGEPVRGRNGEEDPRVRFVVAAGRGRRRRSDRGGGGGGAGEGQPDAWEAQRLEAGRDLTLVVAFVIFIAVRVLFFFFFFFFAAAASAVGGPGASRVVVIIFSAAALVLVSHLLPPLLSPAPLLPPPREPEHDYLHLLPDLAGRPQAEHVAPAVTAARSGDRRGRTWKRRQGWRRRRSEKRRCRRSSTCERTPCFLDEQRPYNLPREHEQRGREIAIFKFFSDVARCRCCWPSAGVGLECVEGSVGVDESLSVLFFFFFFVKRAPAASSYPVSVPPRRDAHAPASVELEARGEGAGARGTGDAVGCFFEVFFEVSKGEARREARLDSSKVALLSLSFSFSFLDIHLPLSYPGRSIEGHIIPVLELGMT